MLSCVINHLMNVDLFKILMVNLPNGDISSKSTLISNYNILQLKQCIHENNTPLLSLYNKKMSNLDSKLVVI